MTSRAGRGTSWTVPERASGRYDSASRTPEAQIWTLRLRCRSVSSSLPLLCKTTPMEEQYEKIREQALTGPEKAEAEPEAKPEAEPEATEAEPEKPEAEKPEAEKPEAEKPKAVTKTQSSRSGATPKEKPPRMICEGCGRSYSIHTKRHVCRPPKGFEKKESPKETPELPQPPVPGPAERQITLSDVTEFLFAESKARREKRRDDLLAKMF